MSHQPNIGTLPKTPIASPVKNTSDRVPQNPKVVTFASEGVEIPTMHRKRNQNKRRVKKTPVSDSSDLEKQCDFEVEAVEHVKIVNENSHAFPKPSPKLPVAHHLGRKSVPYVEKPYPPSMQCDVLQQHGYSAPMAVLSPEERFGCDKNYIEIFNTRCDKHPKAQFQCKLCSYYCDNITIVGKHINDKRHLEAMRVRRTETTIAKMPRPGQGQLTSLTELVKCNYTRNGLSYVDREMRQNLAKRLNDVVTQALPTVSLRLYGSSVTCMGLKSSDMNLDLVVPANHTLGPARVMLAVADHMGKAPGGFTLVDCNLSADLPAIVVRDGVTQLKCVICPLSETAYEVTQLLACYEAIDERVKPLAAMLRVWAAECLLDKVNLGTWPPYAFALLLIYYLQQMVNPVLPVLHCLVPNPKNNPSVYLRSGQLGDLWECKNTQSLGELWLNFFRFYVSDFAMSERIVCIQQLDPLLRSTKKWGGRKLAIEDPFIAKRNVSKSIVNMVTFDFILHCFRTSYLYYAIPQMEAGPLFGGVDDPMDPTAYGPHVEAILLRELSEMELLLRCEPEFSALGGQIRMPGRSHPNLVVTPKIAQEMCQRFNCSQLYYTTERHKFWGNQVLPVVCVTCSMEGHLKGECPEQKLPPAIILPPMTEQMVGYLNQVCTYTFKMLSPTEEEIKYRQEIVNDLEAFLMESDPAIKLDLFGSSCNGFGFVKSDLDICLTFRHDKTGESLNFARIVEDITAKCRKYKDFTSLVAITTAKVPILKFVYNSPDGLEGDISVYNTLAQRNTKMLRAYADIDVRVRMLGFMMKKFAKLCDICDASRGSLSSYAYILMVIYFLQQCNPPVLPVLQELCRVGTVPTPVVVDNVNTYFFEDVSCIAEVWLGYGRNTTPVGLLWHQLICFYADCFPFSSEVVCIRQSAKLTRFEKLWNTKSIAIEDPFDVTHNLGAGLSIKMNTFILKTFLRGREHFGIPVLLPDKIHVQDYFFSRRKLVDGAPPNDRGCRVCKKIGHQVKDCPVKKSANDWKQQKRVTANQQTLLPQTLQHQDQMEQRGGRNQRHRGGPPASWKNENARFTSLPHVARQYPSGGMNGALHSLPPGLALHGRGNHLLEQRLNAQGHHYTPSQNDIARLEQIRRTNIMTGSYNMTQRSNW